MKHPARLIIPVWGEQYVNKVLTLTLPAVLAPGNLPALREMFEVELVIVTESRLFDLVRDSQSFQSSARLCSTRLILLDDLITDIHGDYGMVLTYALFRGFADLGARTTETYLLFLNADFIISDGSLRHLGELMRQGKRVIQAPSFRVTLEDVWPRLQAHVDLETCTLQMTPREMAKLALANKHPTVKARTVNQRLSHLSWMDQYYWYVDEDTMIGYQSPMALVAIKPERVVSEPSTFWDYGFVPEAAPAAEPEYITDSDHFLMIEPQSRDTGREMIRTGWLSLDDLARSESSRTTKEHRESGKRVFTIHAGDLPADLQDFVDQSRAYMAEIYRRLSPTPAAHQAHPVLGRWFEEAKQRRRGTRGAAPPGDQGPKISPKDSLDSRSAASRLSRLLRAIYGRTFGIFPHIRRCHPLWAEIAPITSKIVAWRHDGKQKILWISSTDSVLHRLLGKRVDPAALFAPHIRIALQEQAPYDACICQLTLPELEHLDRLYSSVRPLIRDEGAILVSVIKQANVFEGAEFFLAHINYPDVDVSDIHFNGTTATGVLRALYLRASRLCADRPIVRGLIRGATLLALAPAVRLANARASRRDKAIFSPTWTSLSIEFAVKRGTRRGATHP